MTFVTGTIHLLGAANARNRTIPRRVAALESTRQCIESLHKIGHAYHYAELGAQVLTKMVEDWVPVSVRDARAETSASSNGQSEESVASITRKLQDPNSELAKVLAGMGWQPPPAHNAVVSTPATGTSSDQASFLETLATAGLSQPAGVDETGMFAPPSSWDSFGESDARLRPDLLFAAHPSSWNVDSQFNDFFGGGTFGFGTASF